MKINYEKLDKHVFVTKLAGFEHTKYIQNNETKEKENSDDIPLVQGKNIKNGLFIEKYEWYIKKEISDKLTRSKLTKDCILLPYVGGLGEIGIFYHKYDCHLASNIAKIELIDDYFDLEYLKYYLQSPTGQSFLFQSKQGSVQSNITMESIRNTNVINYPKEYQRKIAKTLKLLDDKIINNKKIIDKYESLLKILFDYWFLQFNFFSENKKTYNSAMENIIWNEKIRINVPKTWEVIKIGDIIIENEKSKIKVNEALNSGKYLFFTSGESILRYNEYLVDGFNIFLNTGGNPGIKAYKGKCFYSTDTWSISAGKYTYFLYYYLLKLLPQFEMLFFAGSGLKHLQKNALKEKYIFIPEDKVLNKFNDIAENIWHKKEKNYNECEELSNLFDFLLPLLMNGQVTFKEDK